MHQIELTHENMNHNVFVYDEANLINVLCVTINSKTQLQTKWSTQAFCFFRNVGGFSRWFWRFDVKYFFCHTCKPSLFYTMIASTIPKVILNPLFSIPFFSFLPRVSFSSLIFCVFMFFYFSFFMLFVLPSSILIAFL